MLLVIGTAVVASTSAVMLARHQAMQSRQINNWVEKELAAHGDSLHLSIELGNPFKAPRSPVFEKLQTSLSQFNQLAAARAESKVSPISPPLREAVNVGCPRIMENLANALHDSEPINEKEVNEAIELHELTAGFLSLNGNLIKLSTNDLLAALRRANAMEQGRMNKEYIRYISSIMEFTLTEVIKTLLRGEEHPPVNIRRALSENLMRLTHRLDERTEKRMN